MSKKENVPQKANSGNTKKEDKWMKEIVTEKKAQKKQSKTPQTQHADMPVNKLPGIGPALAEKLMTSGYLTLASIAHASPMELIEQCEIGEHTARRLIAAARSQVGIRFKNAKEIYQDRQNLIKIPVGCDSLDTLLEGGIEIKALTEISGEFRTGKTQICFQLCVTAAMDKKLGGLEAGVIYIDTEGTFRPERIMQIAERFGASAEKILERIHVGRAYNSDHQMVLVLESPKLIQQYNVRLMIIDSLTSHFRAEFTGRDSLLERQQKLNKFLHQLLRLADVYNIAVVATNQVVAKPDVLYGESVFPIGGNIVAHSCTTRIYLRKGKGEKRIARVIDSPYIPETEAVFAITKDGIVDTE
ncbi:MAG: DNA repair and recombination protein RadA [Candidatus Heimdallarchaeaceae archaeon]